MKTIDNLLTYRGVQGIYGIKNLVNGKIYVGQAVNTKKRLYGHRSQLRRKKHHNPYLQNAWNKYGEDKFQLLEIEVVPDVFLLVDREEHWIGTHDAYNKKCGYNIAAANKAGPYSEIQLLRSIQRKKKEAIKRLHRIIKRYCDLDNLPVGDDTTTVEKQDVMWIITKREAKEKFLAGKQYEYYWYPELDEIAMANGFGGMFDRDNQWTKNRSEYSKAKLIEINKVEAIKRLHEILARYKPSKLPAMHADGQEGADAFWLWGKRAARMGRRACNTHYWYPELDDVAVEMGFLGLFDLRDDEKKSILRLQEFVNKYSPDNLPNQHSFNREERLDAQWLSSKRKAKRGSKNWAWFPCLDQIATEHGFIGLFDRGKMGKRRSNVVGKRND